MKVLKFGSTGKEVVNLQESINDFARSPLQVDGIFGAKTEAAVISIQKNAHITPDGIVGPKTWAAIEYAIDVAKS